MFRNTNKEKQLNLFSNVRNHLTKRTMKIYEDDNEWHNQFRVQVINRIDEELFRPLFNDNFGAPNASIRLLIGMMILKEAQGWSDSQLFENSQFNLLTRSALGLFNIDDPIPAESTYYLLRRRIVDRENEGNENLIEKVFSQVTKSQVAEFKINGKKIRMDSKLLGSNIAWYSRYELIHETLVMLYKEFQLEMESLLSDWDIEILNGISCEEGKNVSYRSNKTEIESKISELGLIIYKIISQIKCDTSTTLQTLRRVFEEQYQLIEDVVIARPKQEIIATSVQSPHDTDCHYRKKGDNQVKGYSINITETCERENKPDLITSVIVKGASAADCDFLQPAIEATREITQNPIETVNADGAYHSESNQDYCQENTIDLIVSAISGKAPRYDLEVDQNNELIVIDTKNNEVVTTRRVETRKEDAQPKWAILTENNKYRYFTQKEIDTCILRKQIAARTAKELNLRNNVEASIFQLGYHYPNDKSRYRGLIKHKIWANVRCMWVNFVRIYKFLASPSPNCVQTEPNGAQNVKNRLFLPQILLEYGKLWLNISQIKIFSYQLPQNSFKNGFMKNYFL